MIDEQYDGSSHENVQSNRIGQLYHVLRKIDKSKGIDRSYKWNYGSGYFFTVYGGCI